MGLCDIFGKKIAVGGSSDFFNVTYPKYSNLYDGSYEIGGIGGSGAVNVAQTSCFVTNFIALSGGAYLYPGTRSGLVVNPEEVASVTFGCIHLAFYDTAKTFISLSTKPTAPVAVPAGAVYCRVSWQPYSMTDLDTSGYFVGVVDSEDAVPAWERYYEPGEVKSAYLKHEHLTYRDKPLHEGKTWVMFADSLADSYGGHDWQESTSPVGGIGWKNTEDKVPWTGYFWATRIARELGLTIDNRAASGSNINQSRVYPTVTGIIKLDAFLAEIEAGTIEQPEYITIGFGTNTVADEIGTADDTSDNTESVYGATKYFVEKLREKCPYSVIGFVLPPVGDWTGVSDVRSIDGGREAIRAVLEEYSVPYIDMSTESGITVDMLPDGIHVSSIEANNLYYHAMRRFMMGL